MRYTQYRGLIQVTNCVKLKFAAMNVKKLAAWKWNDLFYSLFFPLFLLSIRQKPNCCFMYSRVSRQADPTSFPMPGLMLCVTQEYGSRG